MVSTAVPAQNKYLNIVEINSCTGCGACYNKCPVGAISMQENEEGFLIPVVDESKCTNCGLCKKSCPVASSILNPVPKYCYAVMATDDIRLKSSSGGVFTQIANYILENDGYVCGAAWNSDFNVEHILIDSKEDLHKLQCSKYVQSNTKYVYREIKNLLSSGKLVFFTGTPCQVAGLYSFLDNKDFQNLFTMDLVCHGVPNSRIWQKFLVENFNKNDIEKVMFRDKGRRGWKCTTTIYLKNGDIKIQPEYMNGFSANLYLRPSCAVCSYTKLTRCADLSVADFWHVERLNPSLNDGKGTSLVLLNSPKGEILFNHVKDNLIVERFSSGVLDESFQISLFRPYPSHEKRCDFFSHIHDKPFNKLVSNLLKPHFDVGIMGFWYGLNYGSVFTYFSLNRTLQDMGKSVLMIEKPVTVEDYEIKKFHNSRKFALSHFNISKFRPFNKLYELNNICDNFIVGSDQVWNKGCYKWSGYSLFLDFASNAKKIIAVAASFGHAKLKVDHSEKLKIKCLLKRFDAISVREKSAVDILKNDFNIEGTEILDPIFLCDNKHWESLISEVKTDIPTGYVFTYILDPTPQKRELILSVSKNLGKNFINLLDGLPWKYDDNKAKLDLENTLPLMNVQEILAYYKNSNFIITDSFHGTCLALIFRKPFVSIANYGRGLTRFESILTKLNLMHRLVYKIEDAIDNLELLKPIDYDAVYEILDKERLFALNWIKSALDKPVKKNKVSLQSALIGFIFNFGNMYSEISTYLNYTRCKVLSYIVIGEKKNHYKQKSLKLHNLVRGYRNRRKVKG